MTIYQEELKRRIREQGYGALYDEETGMLKIYQNGVFLCDQDKNGNLHFTRDAYVLQNFYEISTPIAKEAVSVKDCVAQGAESFIVYTLGDLSKNLGVAKEMVDIIKQMGLDFKTTDGSEKQLLELENPVFPEFEQGLQLT